MGETEILRDLFEVILDRREKRPDGSYTAYLFNKGGDKILKKIGEEATEVIIAAKNGGNKELVAEMADLVYHLLVLLALYELSPEDILAELTTRRGKI